MQTEGNGGSEPVVHTPARTLASASNLLDWLRDAPALRSRQQLGPPLPSQAQPQQPSPLVTPKPLTVQVVPQQPVIDGMWPKHPTQLITENPAAQGQGMPGDAFPISPWVYDAQQAAQKPVDENNERVRHDQRILKRKEYEAADRTETAQEMSPKEWASLSPLQQASVQSNYDLALAVKKDFDSQGKNKSTEAQTKCYNDRMTELFGSEESLNYKGMNFAPNTIAFLDDRGYKAADLAGHTLDDFLSGAALVSAETFKALEEKVVQPDVFHTTDARGKNIEFAQTLAKGQLAYQEGLATKLKQGAALLSDITSSSATANTSYGALQTPTQQLKLPAIQPATFAQLDKYMEVLARTDIDPDLGLSTISQDLLERKVSPEETAQVWQGLSERSRQAMTGDGKWFEGLDFPMRPAAEVAQALGATTLKRQDTTGTGPSPAPSLRSAPSSAPTATYTTGAK